MAARLRQEGAWAQAVYFSADDLESCRRLLEITEQKFGRVDVLVNNVGGTDLNRDGSIADIDIDYFDKAFHLNLRCALYLTRQVIPWMRQGGNIVNIASISGIIADPRGTYYGAAKAGLINMTKYTATQLGKKNIRCNAVAPGLILTPAALENLSEEIRKLFLRHNSLGRLGQPEDIAAAVAFLASEDAAYITGQTLVVDGGLTIHNPTVADMTEKTGQK